MSEPDIAYHTRSRIAYAPTGHRARMSVHRIAAACALCGGLWLARDPEIRLEKGGRRRGKDRRVEQGRVEERKGGEGVRVK
eukprot:3667939-Rhodomonas_salina.1